MVTRLAFTPFAIALFLFCLAFPAHATEAFLAFEIRREGKIIEEGRAAGFSPARSHNVKSLSKSFLAILVGIALKDGLIKDLDENVAPLLWPGHQGPALSWRQLLTMSSGFPSTSGKNYGSWVSSRDWVEYFRNKPRTKKEEINYSTGDAHLLAVALGKKIGRPLSAFAADKLFSPLGISGVGWSRDPQKREFGGNDLSISFRAVSRIGQMLLSGGKWEGKEIVTADWVEKMWAKQAEAPAEFVQFSVRGYGYYWWLVSLSGEEAACALGYGGQVLCLLPGRNAQITLFTRIPPSPKDLTRNWTKVQDFLRSSVKKIQAASGR